MQHLTESKKNSEGGLNRPGVSVAMHMSELTMTERFAGRKLSGKDLRKPKNVFYKESNVNRKYHNAGLLF